MSTTEQELLIDPFEGLETEVEAKTVRSRSDTRKVIAEVFDKLMKASSTSYRISNVDFSLQSPAHMNEVCKDLYKAGFRIDHISLHYDLDQSLGDAKFYSLNKKFPILVREAPTGWGTSIISIGETMPTFQHALDALDVLMDKHKVLTIMHPVEGTSGLAIVADRVKTGRFAPLNDPEKDLLHADMMHPDHDHAIFADDYLLSLGFIQKREVFISMKLGVMVHLTDDKIAIMDTPWS